MTTMTRQEICYDPMTFSDLDNEGGFISRKSTSLITQALLYALWRYAIISLVHWLKHIEFFVDSQNDHFWLNRVKLIWSIGITEIAEDRRFWCAGEMSTNSNHASCFLCNIFGKKTITICKAKLLHHIHSSLLFNNIVIVFHLETFLSNSTCFYTKLFFH